MDPQDEARNLAWVRAFYRDLFADTGGVPVPGGVCDGAMINHPDVDLADPEWNASGVPWHTLHYKDNYPRLQQIKARRDPATSSTTPCRFAPDSSPAPDGENPLGDFL
jgi:aclacinomycin oxidase